MKSDLEYIKQLLKENKSLKEELDSHRTKQDIIKQINSMLKIKGDMNFERLNFYNLETIENSISLLKHSQTKEETNNG